MDSPAPYNLCIATTSSNSILAFYGGKLAGFQHAGVHVTVLCGPGDDISHMVPEGAELIPVRLSRIGQPCQDLLAFVGLCRLFRRRRFDLVQYSTPKASLLVGLAAFLCRTPVRVYVLWGLYYTGQKGLKRRLLKAMEKFICSLSTHIVPIAHEMVDFVAHEGLAPAAKCQVMHHGSACGVDLEAFDPAKWRNAGKKLRDSLNIGPDDVIIGAVARLTGDKGINELVGAFEILSAEHPGLHLLLVGKQEVKDPLVVATEQAIHKHPRIHAVGRQYPPMPYFAAMDIFCLPTYHEGFGEVNLEAQAMELPVVSTDVIGPRESVNAEVTGLLVEPRSVQALLEPLRRLVQDAQLRQDMGRRGRQRVIDKFARDDLVNAEVTHRLQLLHQNRSHNLCTRASRTSE